MTDLTDVYASLKAADAAGDTAAAQKLSDYIRAQPAAPKVDLKAQDPSEYDPQSPEYQAKYGPTGSDTENFLAGAGKSFVDLGRGVGQDLGLVSRKDVQDARDRDAALMKTGAGKFGNVVGDVAETLPMLAIPGAATVRGAAVLGGALGLAQPSTSTKETLANVGLGTVAGAGGQALGAKLASAATKGLASRSAAAAATEAQNAERDAVFKASRRVGYVVPPTATNPSALNTALESISGKAATRQVASSQNAKVTNQLVRSDLGLSPNTALTKGVLQGVRKKAGAAYQNVKDALKDGFDSDGYYQQDLNAITDGMPDLETAYPGIAKQANPQIQDLVNSLNVARHNGTDAVELSKFLRSQAKTNYKAAFGAGGDPTKLALSRAQTQGAQALEDLIQRTLANGGEGNLSTAWDAARTLIAKSHQAEGALRGGNISAIRLAQQMRGGKLTTGGMGVAAKFADHFEDAAKLPKSGDGVSKLASTVAGLLTFKGLASRSPNMLAEAATFGIGPYAARRGMLSSAGQSLLTSPSYRPGLTGTALLKGAQTVGRTPFPTAVPTALSFSPQEQPAMARGGLLELDKLERRCMGGTA